MRFNTIIGRAVGCDSRIEPSIACGKVALPQVLAEVTWWSIGFIFVSELAASVNVLESTSVLSVLLGM